MARADQFKHRIEDLLTDGGGDSLVTLSDGLKEAVGALEELARTRSPGGLSPRVYADAALCDVARAIGVDMEPELEPDAK